MTTISNSLSISNQRTRSWPLVAGLVASAHLANDSVTSMLPALLPSLASRFALTASELALLAGVFAVSTSLPQAYFGALADRLGGHRVGALGLAVSGALIAALTFVSSVPWLCAVFVIGGLGSSALHPAGIGLARAGSANNPGFAVALFSAAGMAGGALGPLLAVGATSSLGNAALAWTAVPVLLIAALFFKLAPRPAVAVARNVRSPGLGLQLLKGPVGPYAFIALCSSVATLTFTSAVPMWLVSERGQSADAPILGWTLATFSSAAAVGGLLGGTLTRWFRTRALVVGSLLLAALALQCVLLARPGSVPYFLAVAAGGALTYIHAPLVMVRAQALAPGAESAVAGVLLGGTTAVAGVIYAGVGAAQSTFGTAATMAAAFLLLLPAAHVASAALRPKECAPVAEQRCDCAMPLCLSAAQVA